MNQKNTLTLIFIFFVVVAGSLFLGKAAGTQDVQTSAFFVTALVVIVVFLVLGQNIWILIPIFAIWTGKVTVLPLPFALANLAVGFAAGAWLLFLATRRQKWTYQPVGIDVFLGLLLVVLVIGWFRNPVGLASIGSSANVGARPYIEVIIALIGYLMLSNQKASLEIVYKLPIWVLWSAGILAIGGTVAVLVPGVGIMMYQVYSGFMPNVESLLDPYAAESESIGRSGFLRPVAGGAIAYIGARIMPLKSLTPNNFKLFMLLIFGTILSLVSGYRSALIAVGFYFIFACWMWVGFRGVLACLLIAIASMSTIIIINEAVPLPQRLQRPLSILPGNWDREVVQAGEDSNEWRLEMWEEILTGDAVENWWIGDGFGFPKEDLDYFGILQATGEISPEQLAEYYVITGGLHSGPLSALKFVGVIGFILYICIAIAVAVKFFKLWKGLRRSGLDEKLQMTVGFYTIFSAYVPFQFIFIFGAFENDLPRLIISVGMWRLLDNVVKETYANAALEAEAEEVSDRGMA
ncbi:MAG: hypothetical protein ACSHYF_11005 [Verrucomicrobiaceae bacterium]